MAMQDINCFQFFPNFCHLKSLIQGHVSLGRAGGNLYTRPHDVYLLGQKAHVQKNF